MGTIESNEPSDWDLAQSAKQGDESAYEALISRYQAQIHSFIFRSVGDVETACDLAQEVFVRTWFALGRVEARARFSTWLFQIAANLCRDQAKSKAARNARQTESFTRQPHEDRSQDREFASPLPNPAQDAMSRELIDSLEAEIRALPEELRTAFILGALEHQSHKEIAAILRISTKAVEVRIYRARRFLVERLSRLGLDR